VKPAARRLRVALPWLGAAVAEKSEASVRLPAAEWLVARAGQATTDRPWRDWLLDDSVGGAVSGATPLDDFPAGPCVRAAWTGERPAGTWAAAAPVHLVTALDHLRLAPPVPLPLEAGESAELVKDLNAQLAHRGFVLEDVAGRGWLCRCPDDLDCRAVEPALAVGGNLRDLMPSGRDASRVRAWVNEAQMVLHEHAVNVRRNDCGLPAVNSVWLWGFGAAGDPRSAPAGALLTDDDWLTGLWRLLGRHPAAPDGLAGALAGEAQLIRFGLVDPRMSDVASTLSGLERRVFAPVRAALRGGRLDEAAFLLGAAIYVVDRGARHKFWRRSRPLVEVLQ
jgi:hypothetical protein